MGSFFYLLVKYVHILSAITAVGSNITYAVWLVRAQRETSHYGFVIKTIKFLDDRVANPAYGVLLITGVLLVFIGGWGLRLWIALALILFAAILAVTFAFYVPAQRGEIAAVDSGDAAAAARFHSRTQLSGITLGVIALVILVLMVFKPGP
jgi:uncharacterized membrane protein